jgi:Rho family protein
MLTLVLFAALKCDLRSDEGFLEKMQLRNQDPVGYDEGLAVARRIKAKRYFGECGQGQYNGLEWVIILCCPTREWV